MKRRKPKVSLGAGDPERRAKLRREADRFRRLSRDRSLQPMVRRRFWILASVRSWSQTAAEYYWALRSGERALGVFAAYVETQKLLGKRAFPPGLELDGEGLKELEGGPGL